MKITQQQLDTLTKWCQNQTELNLSVCAWDDDGNQRAQLELVTWLTGTRRDSDLMARRVEKAERLIRAQGFPCELLYLGENDFIATHACEYEIENNASNNEQSTPNN